ncbi:MAG TPA: aminoacyl-tRNA hydrolase [Miltoncostaeaceae bacterium]|nr:aminoacyl-tRNA hydrolase [Miltoncostaeaceae bacterium]
MVGLGNPGSRYAGTRHNAGEMVVDEVARRLGAGRAVTRYGGRLREARGPSGPVALLVPLTYMNDSGDAVGPAAGSLRAAPGQVLVVHDELDLPFGAVRGKVGGGVGGHNGLRSVTRGLGGPGFARIRLGVGKPPPDFRGDGADWVLMRFTEPAEEVEAMIRRGADMVEAVLADGMPAAVERFHASEPGARAAARAERRETARQARGEAGDAGRADAGPDAEPAG